MSIYKAVLFDLDGTLINTIDDLANATNYMLKSYGYPTHEVELYKMMVGNGMRKLVERALPYDHKTEEEITAALAIFMDYYNHHSLDNTCAYEGVPQTVKQLHHMDIKTAVVTNKAELSAKSILSKLYPDCFDVIIGQRDNLPTKPNPAAALLAMEMLEVTPEQCVFVGDSGVDIQTAVNSGAYPVGVLWGFRDEKELTENGAKTVINEPQKLIDIVLDN